MRRITVTLPVPDGESREGRRAAMERLAEQLRSLDTDIVVESVGPLMVVVRVPDTYVGILRDLGCLVNDEPPAKLEPEDS